MALFFSGCTVPFFTGATQKVRLELKGPKQVQVQALIAPIEVGPDNLHIQWKSLASLKEVEPQRNHPVSVFQGFLPSKSVSVGESWKIESEAVLQLLRQLNENPQLEMHIDTETTFTISFGEKTFEIGDSDSDGHWALFRAYNDHYTEVVFRIHAEFVLEDGYFTPPPIRRSPHS